MHSEPQDPIRQRCRSNNLMNAAADNIIELKSGKTWEQFVREKIFMPLDMKTTTFSITDMAQHPDHGVPYKEKRDSFELYKIPYYEATEGIPPPAPLISNIPHLPPCLIPLLTNGNPHANHC